MTTQEHKEVLLNIYKGYTLHTLKLILTTELKNTKDSLHVYRIKILRELIEHKEQQKKREY